MRHDLALLSVTPMSDLLISGRLESPRSSSSDGWDAGDHLVIVDLRTALDIEAAPYGIPGACRIAPETLQHPHHLIPRDSEVVSYCAEPREATSARMALRLASNGFKSIHPLSGGLEGWREAGFVVEPLVPVGSSQCSQRHAGDAPLAEARQVR